MLFLKHAALEQQWGTSDIRNALGVDANTAKEIATELELMSYAERVPRKAGAWRNTKAGNLVAGVAVPDLSRHA
jgi:Mn-dependent DtxR family transcriptional regulator